MLTDNENTKCTHPRQKDETAQVTDSGSKRNIDVVGPK